MSISTPSRIRRADPALIGIIAIALLARLVASRVLDGDLLSRTWEYEEVALNLLNGRGFVGVLNGSQYWTLVHPLYPALCAAVYSLVGHSSLAAMQVVQAAAVVPAAWFAFRLGSEWGGRVAGLLAAAGVTLHPALLLFSLRRHALWLDAVFFLMLLWATWRTSVPPRLTRSLTLGALFGIGLLSRATTAVFMIAACGWLIWQWRQPLRDSLRHAALICGAAMLLASPWLIRNALVLHRPAGFISPTSYALWIGNNPAATGGALTDDGRPMILTAPGLLAQLKGRPELEQQEIYRAAALRFIAENPGTSAVNYFRKLRAFLFWSAQTGAMYPAPFRVAYQAFYLLLLACAAAGAIRLIRHGHARAVVLCGCFVLSVGLVQSVFFVEGRHRWEVESALVVLAACGIASTLRDVASQGTSRRFASALPRTSSSTRSRTALERGSYPACVAAGHSALRDRTRSVP